MENDGLTLFTTLTPWVDIQRKYIASSLRSCRLLSALYAERYYESIVGCVACRTRATTLQLTTGIRRAMFVQACRRYPCAHRTIEVAVPGSFDFSAIKGRKCVCHSALGCTQSARAMLRDVIERAVTHSSRPLRRQRVLSEERGLVLDHV